MQNNKYKVGKMKYFYFKYIWMYEGSTDDGHKFKSSRFKNVHGVFCYFYKYEKMCVDLRKLCDENFFVRDKEIQK